ncbi:ABC transporter permease [Pseudothermotoga thermarum]|uniref:Inner-membrane translocator n=1 Tax=Pseudothermotoga thermarum DSM 5069 TaxID=688269 RepID=F7YWJ8_9THEM|nr:ABC transporter permease [Pseudothermotoga thermarum]AEH51979.1 inner-membrane translocator [Pseudothermotoga thermarum DSM 5069]
MIPILEQGLLLALAAMGVYISFRLVDLPDLTPDGSYVLGGAVAVVLLHSGHGWGLSVLAAALAAGAAGVVVAFLTTRFKINSLLASILVMTALYSLSIRVMNAPNLPVPKFDTGKIFAYEQLTGGTPLDDLLGNFQVSFEGTGLKAVRIPFNNRADGKDLALIALIVAVSAIALWIFLKTEFGMMLRGYGKNRFAVKVLGVNPDLYAYVGLILANVFVGISGALFSMYSGFADVNMGIGTVVVCLASVILGEIIFGKRQPMYGVLFPIVGAVLYQFLLSLAMKYGYKIGFKPSDMKLVTAIFVVSVIAARRFKKSEVMV